MTVDPLSKRISLRDIPVLNKEEDVHVMSFEKAPTANDNLADDIIRSSTSVIVREKGEVFEVQDTKLEETEAGNAISASNSETLLSADGKPINRPLLLSILILGCAFSALSQTVLNVALVTLKNQFGVSANTIQWLSTGFMLVNGIVVPTTGYLMKVYSTRTLFLYSMGALFVGSVICACSVRFWMMMIGRVIQAAGTGVMMPLVMAVLCFVYPPENRGAAMGMFGLAIIFAPAVGPTLSGLVMEVGSWRWIFVFIAAVFAAVCVLSYMYLINVGTPTKARLDVVGLLLCCAGCGLLIYAFSSAGSEGWRSALVISTLVAGVVLMAAYIYENTVVQQKYESEKTDVIKKLYPHFVEHVEVEGVMEEKVEIPYLPLSPVEKAAIEAEISVRPPLLNLRVFDSYAYSLTSVLNLVVCMVMYGEILILPYILQEGKSYSVLMSGLITLPGAIVNALLAPVAGKLYDILGPRIIFGSGGVLLTAGMVIMMFLTYETPLWWIIVRTIILRVGLTFATMPINTAALNSIPTSFAGDGSAVNTTVRMIGGAIGIAILMTIYSSRVVRHAVELILSGEIYDVMAKASIMAATDAYLYLMIMSCLVFGLAMLMPPRSKMLSYIEDQKALVAQKAELKKVATETESA